MIEDGHFKELGFILNYIYTKRVEFKKFSMKKRNQSEEEKQELDDKQTEIKSKVLKKKDGEL